MFGFLGAGERMRPGEYFYSFEEHTLKVACQFLYDAPVSQESRERCMHLGK